MEKKEHRIICIYIFLLSIFRMPTIFQNIQLSDLPSKKFDNLKISINYELLQSYNKNTISTEKISSWVENFKTKIEKYLINQSVRGLIQNNKGCKDFNFIIDEINQKINSLFNDILDIYKWTQEIKNWRTNYFSSNTDLKCDENDKYIKPVLKDLYDFCEDKIFIEENLRDIEKSVKCQSIYADLSERKVHLINSQSIIERHIERKRIPDISCNTEILDSTFPSINCSVIYKYTPEDGAHISNANHNGREESKERLANQSMNTPRELSNREQGLFTVQGKNETNSDSPSNSIGLVSLPILGTLVLSFLLYRYTPLGHNLHAYFRNNEDVPVNQNYEETNKMLSNISNSNDIYSENMQYNISYQTL